MWGYTNQDRVCLEKLLKLRCFCNIVQLHNSRDLQYNLRQQDLASQFTLQASELYMWKTLAQRHMWWLFKWIQSFWFFLPLLRKCCLNMCWSAHCHDTRWIHLIKSCILVWLDQIRQHYKVYKTLSYKLDLILHPIKILIPFEFRIHSELKSTPKRYYTNAKLIKVNSNGKIFQVIPGFLLSTVLLQY